jgi:hypothetical protein
MAKVTVVILFYLKISRVRVQFGLTAIELVLSEALKLNSWLVQTTVSATLARVQLAGSCLALFFQLSFSNCWAFSAKE